MACVGPFALIVTAEHASNTIPPALAGLGVPSEILASHVAWDPGAREVATALAAALGAPLLLGEHSRLVADLNRSPGTDAVVPRAAFGVVVPGNANLTAEDRAAREVAYHRPYWNRVEEAVRALRPPVLHLSVHSFTPELDGKKREVELGVLHDPAHPLEAEIARLFLPILRAHGFDARANEPYDGRADGLCTALRAKLPPSAYAGVEIEISHELLGALDRVSRALIEAATRARAHP
jgi:predicted N-formylglutamate amidohydrolase